MTDSKQPSRRFQFSLKLLLTYSVVAAVAISLIIKMASASPLTIGLVALWMIATAPFIFFAEIVDWLLGVNKQKFDGETFDAKTTRSGMQLVK
ncbi:hypothetical protein SH528x_004471 [Novipirellula sp. SH528]|uniref:hypothetical protein n=1 Tax=Novipirellula sp. SH528 TaxID=3454466 RepID=UPI003F9F42B3